MSLRFVGGDVWPHITKVMAGRGRRRAAVAYLGREAPQFLRLRRHDILVVNASDAALLAHATSPDALDAYVRAGVRVLSTPTLHAKVIVTPTVAVVGSANASTHSRELVEAVVITKSQATIEAARRFIDGLAHLTQVDRNFVEAARATWARGTPSRLPGISGGPDPGFLPAGKFRLYIAAETVPYDPSRSEVKLFQEAARRARRAAGPASAYYLDSYQQRREHEPFRSGDVIVQIYNAEGERWVNPPEVVVSNPLPIPRSPNVIQLLRGRVDLEPRTLTEAIAVLQAGGIQTSLDSARWARSRLRDAVLDVWNLATTAPEKHA